MKQGKKLTVSMKKLVEMEGLDPNDYFYVKNTIDYLEIIDKVTKETKKIYK